MVNGQSLGETNCKSDVSQDMGLIHMILQPPSFAPNAGEMTGSEEVEWLLVQPNPNLTFNTTPPSCLWVLSAHLPSLRALLGKLSKVD